MPRKRPTHDDPSTWLKEPSESIIKGDIRRHFGLHPKIKLFDHAVGEAEMKRGGYVKYGLAVGGSDLLGAFSFVMNAQDFSVPISFEVKTRIGKPTKQQLAWIACARRMGCIAGIVRSIEDCEALIFEWCQARGIPYDMSHHQMRH